MASDLSDACAPGCASASARLELISHGAMGRPFVSVVIGLLSEIAGRGSCGGVTV